MARMEMEWNLNEKIANSLKFLSCVLKKSLKDYYGLLSLR